jgi:secreted trypsin-like serine protease
MSTILKQVMLPIFDINKCFDVHYSKSRDPLVNTTSEICAGGSEEGSSGVCVSDSGGPLQCQMSDNRWYQIGIISWSYRCAAPGVPDVFTKVSLFNDWIENTIQNN